MTKRKILLLYPYYWPHYKAGGPVQSLFNLVGYFKGSADFYLISLDRDIDGEQGNVNIEVNSWTAGPNGEHIYFVSNFSVSLIYRIIKEVNPDIVFVNGVFNINTTLPGLVVGKFLQKKIIISPRGMLQQGALSVKPLKKKIFLQLFKWSGLCNNVTWHATDQQEALDIQRFFGLKSAIKIAGNIPKKPLTELPNRYKRSDQLSLVYLSLITKKKNLHIILAALNHIKTPVKFDIYGIVMDHDYWERCKLLMKDSKHEIVYRGSIKPEEVQLTLKQYHCFILPTKGENFGHAIYEALSVGLPVILTPYTPWAIVGSSSAGIIVHSESETDWASGIERFIKMEEDEYMNFSTNAFNIAKIYFENSHFESSYEKLFQ